MRNLRSPHRSFYYQFPCFLYNKTFSPPRPARIKNPSDIRLYTDGHTDRQTDRQTLTPHAGIVGVALMTLHHQSIMTPEMYVTFPLPYPSSPASWTLLLPLSVQDSHNISSNDRYHHSLSSLDNNKTGIYLSICLFIYYLFI